MNELPKIKLPGMIKQSGFTREEIAIKVGVTTQTLRNWEEEPAKIPNGKITLLAACFDITPEQMFVVVNS